MQLKILTDDLKTCFCSFISGFIHPHAKGFMQEFDLILQYQDVIESLEDSRRTSGDRSNTQTLAKAQVISPTPDRDFCCFTHVR